MISRKSTARIFWSFPLCLRSDLHYKHNESLHQCETHSFMLAFLFEKGDVFIEIVPISLREANAFVSAYHRHHGPVAGHKFSIGLSDGEKIVGVVIVGRPVSRYLDDGWTLEVNRLCTDGTRNACSTLYGAAWRAARAMGYKRLITYILESETGASLRAAGWKCIGQAGGLRWTGKRRPTVDLYPAQMKVRYQREVER